MANRKDDIHDILDKADPSGWIIPPAKPLIQIEDEDHTFGSYLDDPPTDGVFLIRKNIKRDPNRLSPDRENRVFTYECDIIAQTDDLLELLTDQSEEVFNRYTDAPWSTSTLGTSTTYNIARLITAEQDERLKAYVQKVFVQLIELSQAVKIA